MKRRLDLLSHMEVDDWTGRGLGGKGKLTRIEQLETEARDTHPLHGELIPRTLPCGKTIRTLTKVHVNSLANRGQDVGNLVLYYTKPIYGVIGYMVDSVVIERPLYMGDTNAVYFVTTNLKSKSHRYGSRLGDNTQNLLCVVPRSTESTATQSVYFGRKESDLTLFRSAQNIDVLEFDLLDETGTRITTSSMGQDWFVTLTLLFQDCGKFNDYSDI